MTGNPAANSTTPHATTRGASDEIVGSTIRGVRSLLSWHNTAATPDARAAALLAELTLEEKLAQLGSAWVGNAEVSGNVAPMQDVWAAGASSFETVTGHGLGQLTRPFGTKPQTTTEGVERVVELQTAVVKGSRLGIPAIVHEECLTGFTTMGATVYPASIAWAATWSPDLVQEMAAAIGTDMAAVGVHQGLSPVLDVVRDYRWGRVEETLGEDPYLVAILGSAYVKGLEQAGVVATLKHFCGYSASRAARNHAPVTMGPREFRDIMLIPFETAIREGGARSVMNSYSDVDGAPAAADPTLLTGILRNDWGFTGTVVSDYWSVAFLKTMHCIADTVEEAGALALAAGLDVELPDTLGFGDGLLTLVRSGQFDESMVDRAAFRVLRQKAELGLLDADWTPEGSAGAGRGRDLDSPSNRDIARRLAEHSITLLANDAGVLPLTQPHSLAVVGPCANDALTFMGCYSYPNHVLGHFPDMGIGVAAPSLLEALRDELHATSIHYARGVPVKENDRSGIAAAVSAAAGADVCVAVVGDRAGLFGRGTSGEGCDAEDLSLPGVQDELVEALIGTGTPVVLVVVSGRPYALGRYATKVAAMVQAFMPGEEGGPALAGVLSGRVNPSGRLPVQVPALAGGQPSTYLQAPLGLHTEGISNLDPTPLFAFGHGLSYTTFGYSDLDVSAAEIGTDSAVEAAVTVTNTGERRGEEIVQLYFTDVKASLARPAKQLTGFARVSLEPGHTARVTFTVHAERTAFTGFDMRRIVEPGVIDLLAGPASDNLPARGSFTITGTSRAVGPDRVLTTPVRVSQTSF